MHKSIGILGGMAPESTMEYYRYIVQNYVERYGDHGYPEVLIYSVSFQDYIDWPAQGRWDLVADGLSEAARKLEAAGADCVLISTNTMHIVYEQVRAAVGVPVLSLLDAVGDDIIGRGMSTVGLLGTVYTMTLGFYQDALAKKGISVIVPDEKDIEFVNKVLYEETSTGLFSDESRDVFVEVIGKLAGKGAEGVILGCTEIPLLVKQHHTDVPLIDSTSLHAEAALQFAIGGK